MKDFIKIAKALSDETRLRIVNVLLLRECCVCEVMQALDISQSRASRNLKVLYDAGLVGQRKDGLWSLYSIDEQAMAGHFSDLLEVVRKASVGSTLVKDDRERLKQARRVGIGCTMVAPMLAK